MGGLKLKVIVSTSFSVVAPKMALNTMQEKISLECYNKDSGAMRMRKAKTENKGHLSYDTEQFERKYTRIT